MCATGQNFFQNLWKSGQREYGPSALLSSSTMQTDGGKELDLTGCITSQHMEKKDTHNVLPYTVWLSGCVVRFFRP